MVMHGQVPPDDVSLAPSPPSLLLRVVKTVLRLAVLAVVVYYTVHALAKGLSQVHWEGLSVNWWLLAVTLVMSAVTQVLAAESNRLLLAEVFGRIRWRQMAAATWIARLGKYVPGKMASVAGAAYMLRRYGVPAVVGANVVVLTTALSALVGLVLSAPLMMWEPVRQRVPLAWLWGLIAVVGGCIAVHPRVNIFFVNLLLRLAKRPPLKLRHSLSHYGGPLVYTLIQWLIGGVGTWLMVAAFAPISLDRLPLMISASSLAVTTGLIVLISPGGLGVREAIYLLVLQQVTGVEVASIVTVTSRMVSVISELMMAGVGVVILRLDKMPAVQPPSGPEAN